MRRSLLARAWLPLATLALPAALAAQMLGLEPMKPLAVADSFKGDTAAENLSGADVLELGDQRFLAVVSDEGTQLALIELKDWTPTSKVTVIDVRDLCPDRKGLDGIDEIDLEGVAARGDHLFVAGSASLKRKKPKPGDSADKNRKRLAEVESPGGDLSDFVYELEGEMKKGEPTLKLVDRTNVRKLLKDDPWVGPFVHLPSKDNGLDIEGLEASGKALYLGLRGPVLRTHAVVARVEGKDVRLSFLNLGGLGVRALWKGKATGLGEGFFVLAGPTMDMGFPFALYRWDGETDSFEGEPAKGLTLLGYLKPPCEGCKPEGLVGLDHDLVVLFDGPRGGAPQRIRPPAKRR